MERLSVVIATVFKDSGIKTASRAVKGLSDEIDSVGDRAQRSASRTRMAYASVARVMRETRAEAKKGAEFKVSANVSALAGVRRVFQGLRQDAGRGATFKLRSDQRGLAGIGAAFSGVRRDAARGTEFRVRGVLSGFSGIPGVLASTRADAARGATFRLNADTSGVASAFPVLNRLDARAREMDNEWGNSIDIHANPDFIAAMARIAVLEARLNEIDNRTLRINAVVSGASSVTELSGKIRALGTVLTVASTPALISMLAAVPAVASAAAAGVGALAVGVGSGLVGAVAVGAPAIGGMIGGLKAYTAVLKSSVTASREAYLALDEDAAKQREDARAKMLNTEASIALNQEIDDSLDGFAALQAAVGNEAFPIFTRELDYWNEYLAEFTPEIARTAGAVAGVAAEFSKFVRTAQEGRLLRETFDFINASAVRGAQVVSDFGQAGLLVFQQLIGPATDLQLKIVGIADSTREWVASSEGTSRIQGAIAYVSQRAGELLGILGNLGMAFVNIGVALERSGLVGMAMGGLAVMAQNFRNATSSSSGLAGNMERLKPVLGAIAGLATVVWTEFWKVADAVLAATNPDTGQSTLLELMDSLADVVPVIGDTLVATFEELAPAISRNIGPISEFVGNFIGSTDTLVAVVDGLGNMADRFNALPAPVKDAAAELAAVAAVASVLGVGPMSLLQVGAYASIVGANMVTMAPAIATAATALWGYASAAAAALLPFAGLAALGLIAIGVAVTFDWGGAADAYARAREEGDHVGVAFGEALDAGLASVPILGSIWGAWRSAVEWLHAQKPPESLLDKLTGAGKDDPSIVPNLTAMWEGAREFLGTLGVDGPSMLDVLMGKAETDENPITKALSGWWTGATEWLAGLAPEVGLLDVLMGRGEAGENPILGTLMSAWTGVTEWLAGLVPERSLMDVLMGAAEGVDNWFLTPLVTAWAGVTEWLAALVPERSLMDVLMGAAEGVDNWLLTPLVAAWTGVTEWLASLVPEISILDVLLGRGEAGDNPLLAPLLAAWTGVTEWLASLVPEVSVLDVLMGRNEAGENPILATVMGWWTGFVAWLTPTLVTLGTLFLTGWTYVSTVTTTALTTIWTFVQGWWTTLSTLFTTGLAVVGQVFLAGWTFVSTTTSTVFGAVWAFLQGWWTTLSGYFQSALQVVGSAVSAGWQFVSTTTSSVYSAIASFLGGWWDTTKGLFSSALEAVKSAVGTAWDWISTTTSSVYGAVASFLSGWWDTTKGLFSSAVDFVKQAVETGWNWISTATSSVYGTIASFLGGWWDTTKGLFSSSLEAVKQGLGAAWEWISTTTSSVFDAIGRFLSGWWDTTTQFFSSSLDSIKTGVGEAWDWLKTTTDTAYTNIRDSIVTKFTDAKDTALRIAGELKDDALGVFNTLKESTLPIFEAVGRFMTDPIETAKGTLAGLWNGILDGIARVLDAVNLGEWAGKVRGAKFENGGVASSAGVSAFAQGGMGTDTPNARVHVWNEQQGNEAYIAQNGPRAAQLSYLDTAASWFGRKVVPDGSPAATVSRGSGSMREHRDSRGRPKSRPERRGEGVPKRRMEGFGPTMYTLVPELRRVADAVANKYGTPWNTYSNHPGPTNDFAQPFYRERSVDFWGPGGRGDPIGPVWRDVSRMALGMIGSDLDWTLDPDNDPAGHWDHVHITAFTGNQSGGGGGFSIPNPLQAAFESGWNRFVKPLFEGAKKAAFPTQYVMDQAGRGGVDFVHDGLYEWIDEKIPDTIGGGGGAGGFSGGGTEAKNRELGQEMTEARGWGSQFGSVDNIVMKESRWDHLADNPVSTAFGIFQMLTETSRDPATQIGNGLGYIADRYGDPNGAWNFWQANGWYKSGGVIPGGPNEPYPAILHGGEGIMPRLAMSSFEHLARSITLWSGRTGGSPEGPAPAEGGNAEIIAKLEETNRRLAEMDEHLDNLGLSREAIAGMGGAAREGFRDYAGTHEFGDRVKAHADHQRRVVRAGGG